MFDACEKDIQQRREDILKVLYIPPSNKVKISLTKVSYVSVKGVEKGLLWPVKGPLAPAISFRTLYLLRTLLKICQQ